MDREVAYKFRDILFKLVNIKHSPDFEEVMERTMYKLEESMYRSFGQPDQIFMSPATLTSFSTMLDSKQGAPSTGNSDDNT